MSVTNDPALQFAVNATESIKQNGKYNQNLDSWKLKLWSKSNLVLSLSCFCSSCFGYGSGYCYITLHFEQYIIFFRTFLPFAEGGPGKFDTYQSYSVVIWIGSLISLLNLMKVIQVWLCQIAETAESHFPSVSC